MSANGTYKFIYTVNGCADTVQVVRTAKPVAGSDQAICAPATTASLTGFSPANGTWSAQAGNPATATVTNAGAVSGMSANGTYKFIYTVNGCADTVQVVRTAKPVVGDAAICEPATTTSVSLSPAGGTWVAAGTNPANATITANGSISGLTANGTYRFIYTVGGCSDTSVVVRKPKPNAGPDQAICAPASTASLSGLPVNGTWSVQTGNPSAATVTNAGVVSGMSANGSYKFIYTLDGCSDTVTVVRKAKPVVGDAAICEPATTASVTLTPAGGTWAAAGNNPANATITPNGAVSGLTVNGTYRFIYTVEGCSDTSIVVRNAKPNAGVDKSLACADPVQGTLQTSTTLTGFSPSGGTFSAQAGNPAAASVTNAGAVSGMNVAGSYKFIYTVGTCSDTVMVTVQSCQGCTKPDAGNDQSICAPLTVASLVGFTPSGGSWSAQAGNPASATVTSAGAVSGLTANGTYRFIYSVVFGGQTCSDTVVVVRKVKPNAGVDQSICEPQSTLSLTGFTPNGGTWTAESGNPANATITNAGVVSGLVSNGTYKFIYTLDGCADTLAIVRKPKPNAGTDKAICEPQSTTALTDFSPANGTWSAQAGNPAGATITNAGAVSGMSVNGIYKFIYTVNGCADTVQVVRTAKPVAGNDQSLACANPTTNTLTTSTTLTGFSPSGGTWSAQSGNPASATVTNAGAVSGMSVAGTYQFIYTVSGCTDTVSVVVQPCQGCVKPNAGPDAAICAPLTASKLTAVTAGGTWSPIVSPANPAAASIDASGNVSGMSANGTYRFVYSVTSGGQTCTDTASVVRTAKPVAGNDQTLACANPTTNTLTTSTTLTGFSPSGGTWSAQSGNPASATVTNAGAVAGMSVAGTYRFIYTVSGCTDTVSVVVQPCQGCVKPNAGPDAAICAPLTASKLTAVTAGGTWSPIVSPANPAAATH